MYQVAEGVACGEDHDPGTCVDCGVAMGAGDDTHTCTLVPRVAGPFECYVLKSVVTAME